MDENFSQDADLEFWASVSTNFPSDEKARLTDRP